MGNDIDKSTELKRLRFLEMFHRNFTLLEERNDDMFGPIELYTNKNTNQV